MAWQRRAKKEIAEGWKWMRKQNPNAAEDAKRWAEEHGEELREADRMLYRSDERYYGKASNLEAETEQSIANEKKYVDPDMPLPQAARDRIYEDHVHIPNEFYREGSDDDDTIRLPKALAEGLDALTDLQREVIFRNVINGEPASVIAQEKDCSARNIRDIRARALKSLRVAATKGRPGTGYPDAALFILWFLLVCAAVYLLLVPDAVEAWIRIAAFIALPVVTVASVCVVVHKLRNSLGWRLRAYWQEKK